MILYAARHGQTEWNAEDRVCGSTDVALSERGLRQAHELAEALRGRGIGRIFCSPLTRAAVTARLIADALGLEAVRDERLAERDFGAFEGASRFLHAFLEAKRQFPARLSGGESILQLAHRVYGLLDDLRAVYPEETVLLVAHGSVCRVIHSYFYDLTNEEYAALELKNGDFREYQS